MFRLDYKIIKKLSSLISLVVDEIEYECECVDDFDGINCTEVVQSNTENHFILALVTFTLSVFLAVIVLTGFCLRQARNPVKSAPLIRASSTSTQV